MSMRHARSSAQMEEDVELREWLDSLDFVLQERGRERAEQILRRLRQHASQAGVTLPFTANTPSRRPKPSSETKPQAKPAAKAAARPEKSESQKAEAKPGIGAEASTETENEPTAESGRQASFEAEKEEAVIPFRAETAEQERRPAHLAPASPAIRRFARELGVDINKVIGTGPDGRIDEQDVKNYATEIISGAAGSP